MSVRIRITAEGIYGGEGPLEIGTKVSLKSRESLPAGWKGKYEIIGDTEDKVPVQTKKTKKRLGLETQATKLGVEFSDDTSDDDLIAAIKAAKS